MHVYRYSKGLQQQLGSKTKPEPWLHCTYQINADKKGGQYVIFVWDSRQVVEEGELSQSQLFEQFKYGRYSEYHTVFKGKPAVDNGQPLKGAKFKWQLVNDGGLPKLEIKGIKMTGTQYVYTLEPGGGWDITCNINDHVVVFQCGSSRFGLVGRKKPGFVQCGQAVVDEKFHFHRLFKEGTRRHGVSGWPLWCDVKCTPVGKPDEDKGQKYKVADFSKDMIANFVKLMTKEPAIFSAAFKNAIK